MSDNQPSNSGTPENRDADNTPMALPSSTLPSGSPIQDQGTQTTSPLAMSDNQPDNSGPLENRDHDNAPMALSSSKLPSGSPIQGQQTPSAWHWDPVETYETREYYDASSQILLPCFLTDLSRPETRPLVHALEAFLCLPATKQSRSAYRNLTATPAAVGAYLRHFIAGYEKPSSSPLPAVIFNCVERLADFTDGKVPAFECLVEVVRRRDKIARLPLKLANRLDSKMVALALGIWLASEQQQDWAATIARMEDSGTGKFRLSRQLLEYRRGTWTPFIRTAQFLLECQRKRYALPVVRKCVAGREGASLPEELVVMATEAYLETQGIAVDKAVLGEQWGYQRVGELLSTRFRTCGGKNCTAVRTRREMGDAGYERFVRKRLRHKLEWSAEEKVFTCGCKTVLYRW